MSKKSEGVKRWRQNTKLRLIRIFGGGCGLCGYNNCSDALELHHLNPTEKDFSLGYIMAHIISWERICEEARKCVLLCSNCHKEVHAGFKILSPDIKKFDEQFVDYQSYEKDLCPVCKKLKDIHLITCSHKCGSSKEWMDQIGNKLEKLDIFNLYEIQHKSFDDIADLVGCSGYAIRKRYQKLKLLEGKSIK